MRRLAFALPIAIIVLIGASRMFFSAGGDRGWITILSGRFTPDQTTSEECASSEQQILCYAQAFGNIAFYQGGDAAMTLLLKASAAAEDRLADCHAVAHMVGTAAYYGLDGDFSRAYASGSRECAGGYYHGVNAAEVASHPNRGPEDMGLRFGALCYRVGREAEVAGGEPYGSTILAECAHGLGHVAQHTYDYELPDALRACTSMRSALRDLEVSDREDRDYFFACAQGAFMENSNTRGGPESKWIDEQDPSYPCSMFDDPEIGTACWDAVPGSLRAPVNATIDQLVATSRMRFNLCSQAQLAVWRDRCYELTRRISINEQRNDPDLYRQICALDPVGVPDCLRSIASEMMLRNSSTNLGEIVCAAASGPEQADACGVGLGQGLKYIPLPVERCADFTPALIEPCRRGYQLP